MQYLIDVGSSTIKVYRRCYGEVELIDSQSFEFKKDLNEKHTRLYLRQNNIDAIYSFFNHQISKYGLNRGNTKIFATGVFRKLQNKKNFVSDFYINTGLYFNIIPHDLEAFYSSVLWESLSQSHRNLSFMVLNIGGDTTELIIYKNGKIKDKQLLKIGTNTFFNSEVNSTDFSQNKLYSIIEVVESQLPTISERVETAIYTGGELSFMKNMGYSLRNNNCFVDSQHPYMVTIKDYIAQNNKLFFEISLEKMMDMKPDNPRWMLGAQTCSAIAQSIFLHYGVNYIIPSDTNLIDGVNMQEVRNVVLCGSYRKFLPRISEIIDLLKKNNINVLSPKSTKVVDEKDGFVLFENDKIKNHCTYSVEYPHLKAIDSADCIIVCNFDGYVGSKTSFEIGDAFCAGKKIVFLENNAVVDDIDIPCDAFFLPLIKND